MESTNQVSSESNSEYPVHPKLGMPADNSGDHTTVKSFPSELLPEPDNGVDPEKPVIGLFLPKRPPRPKTDDLPERVKQFFATYDKCVEIEEEALRRRFEQWGYRSAPAPVVWDAHTGADHNKNEGKNVHDVEMKNAEKQMEKSANSGDLKGVNDAKNKLLDGN